MALEEDLGKKGDITSRAIFSGEVDNFVLIAKSEGILCGSGVFSQVCKKVDKRSSVVFEFHDGDRIRPGDVIARLSGKVASVLSAERTAINFLSLLSGIATKTAEFVAKTDGRVKILDTRKTFPGYRELQKYAVLCGGGSNHRMGLFDMVLIKDNHIDAAGNITEAVKNVRRKWGNRYKLEVEARNSNEVREALIAGADRIMLDNMDAPSMRTAVEVIGGKAEVEASGNMTFERISEVADTGVDFISIGALTHTVEAFDFSLKQEKKFQGEIVNGRSSTQENIEYIRCVKRDMGDELVIPAHHYQRSEIVALADFTGDSYRLSVECAKKASAFTVFCGVRFMAESAAALGAENNMVVMPDSTAGCPMAEMIDRKDAEKVLENIRLTTGLDPVPLVYMNSELPLKGLCGERGGSVCTSSNAERILSHFLKLGRPVFFFPDFNLGINTAKVLGISESDIVKVKRNLEFEAGSDPRSAKLFLWDGYCVVHKRFKLDDIRQLRISYPGIRIIVHPECDKELVDEADIAGSTDRIFNEIHDSPAGSVWGVGTETTFVRRIAEAHPDKTILPLRDSACRNMSLVTAEKLARALDDILRFRKGEIPDIRTRVVIDRATAANSAVALRTMMEIAGG